MYLMDTAFSSLYTIHGQRTVTNEEEWALWCCGGELSLMDVTGSMAI